jgi:hypothetical protein
VLSNLVKFLKKRLNDGAGCGVIWGMKEEIILIQIPHQLPPVVLSGTREELIRLLTLGKAGTVWRRYENREEFYSERGGNFVCEDEKKELDAELAAGGLDACYDGPFIEWSYNECSGQYFAKPADAPTEWEWALDVEGRNMHATLVFDRQRALDELSGKTRSGVYHQRHKWMAQLRDVAHKLGWIEQEVILKTQTCHKQV